MLIPSLQSVLHRFLLVLVCLWSSGCVHTPLSSPALPHEIIELAAGGAAPIAIEIDSQEYSEQLGFQYLLIILPFGEVTAPHLPQTVSRSLYGSLALKGYRPIKNPDLVPVTTPRLLVKVSSASASAYDLLFLRRVSTSIELELTLKHSAAPPLHYRSYGSCGEFKAVGFEPQLRRCLEKAINQAVDNGLYALGL